ncbi:hypothetical protein M3Y98_01197100 [Aphelenchoides besseyi]|nr:hypothetical protein M3Y98_01197100 [Aphelenchoides besseyi]KAI6193153.1 hypothetical protein M3Y96_00988100 [Aphelenchoides besseyi]
MNQQEANVNVPSQHAANLANSVPNEQLPQSPLIEQPSQLVVPYLYPSIGFQSQLMPGTQLPSYCYETLGHQLFCLQFVESVQQPPFDPENVKVKIEQSSALCKRYKCEHPQTEAADCGRCKNRDSARRSRENQKEKMKKLEDENRRLRQQIDELLRTRNFCSNPIFYNFSTF